MRTLAETGNATLAAERAGVSRDWAFKRRKREPHFAELCREAVRWFREGPGTPSFTSAITPPSQTFHRRTADGASKSAPPLPPHQGEGEDRGKGRGKLGRTRINRDRKDGWTAAKEARFIERLSQTCSVMFAACAVGLSPESAYLRRQRRPGFAAAWAEAERIAWPPAEQPWIEAALCFFEKRDPPPDNPVRFASIGEVIDALYGGRLFQARKPRGRK